MRKIPKSKSKEWLKESLIKYKTIKALCSETGEYRSTVYKYIRKYKLQKYIENPEHQNKIYDFNHNFFDDIDNEKKAYWLGFFMADGNVSDMGRKSYTARITLKKDDKEHLEKFAKDIGINKKISTNSRHARIAIHSKSLYFGLIKHNVVPNKTGHKFFPKIRKNLIRHYIRGFFDGDGTIYARKQESEKRKRSLCAIGFCCANEEFLNSIKNIFHDELKIDVSVHHKRNKTAYEIKTESINYCKAIIDYFYRDATVYLERKHERALEFLNQLSLSGRKARKKIE